MSLDRRTFLGLSAAASAALLAGCSSQQESFPSTSDASDADANEPTVDVTAYADLALDMDAWSYDESHDVYYQLAVPYCLNQVAKANQCLSIYVPGPYFNATENGSTYSCRVNSSGTVGSYTALDAPVVFPINCPSYSAQQVQSSYSYEGLKPYLQGGCVYVYPGCRGRASGYDSNGDGYYAGGFPWMVSDLKAAIRYVRYNASSLPIDKNQIVVLGLGAGGCVASILGTSGDAPGYERYLDSVGAAMWDAKGKTISDAVSAVALWNPQAGLPTMDSAYEWLYGQYATDGTRADGLWTQALSRNLAEAWPSWLNSLGLESSDGTALTLEQTSGGLYADGGFYDALVAQLEDAAEAFFEQTTFPTTINTQMVAGGAFPGGNADAQATAVLEAQAQGGVQAAVTSASYQSAEEYVATLNAATSWLTYTASTTNVRIASLGGYAQSCAPALLPCTAYDGVECKTVQNQCFGIKDTTTLHFSRQIWDVLNSNMFDYSDLEGWDATVVGNWGVDLQVKNEMGETVEQRAQAADPFSYLEADSTLTGTGTLAAHWRINMGLQQSQAPLSNAYALACALQNQDGVSDVAFTGVWGAGYDLSERSGEPEANFLSWLGGFAAGNESAADETSAADAGSDAQ